MRDLFKFPGRTGVNRRQHRQGNQIWPAVLVLILLCLALPAPGLAKIDLVTLSSRDNVQTTIYKSEDLTLVRDTRTLQLAAGENQIQFSWANTRIDPTSLTLELKSNRDRVTVKEMVYPPNARDLAIWTIQAKEPCQAKIDILYFTSGLSWQAYYMAFLSEGGDTMDLKGYVRVSNHSGEDYARAQTRLVVGKISLLYKIAVLARQRYPFGRPQMMLQEDREMRNAYADGMKLMQKAESLAAPVGRPKEIVKQGLSEYFLYTIEGRETIEDGWSRRLVSSEAGKIPVADTYTYEKERYGDKPVHRLVFHNRKEDRLGATPLPGGEIKVYQSLGEKGALVYRGADSTPYIPVGKKVELNLGPSDRVRVDPRLMAVEKTNLAFDKEGNLTGFDEVRDYEIHLANYSGRTAALEIIRNLDSHRNSISRVKTEGRYEKTDQDTFTFYNTLAPAQTTIVRYRVTLKRGDKR